MLSLELLLESMNQDRFYRRPENLQFDESADGRSPKFIKGVTCCICLGIMLWFCIGSKIFKILYFLNLL